MEWFENCWNPLASPFLSVIPTFHPSILIDESAKKDSEIDVAKNTTPITSQSAMHGANLLSRTMYKVSHTEIPKNLPPFVRTRRKAFFGDSVG